MKKRYFMGMDAAKATFDFCLLSGSGACLWRGQLSNDACGKLQDFQTPGTVERVVSPAGANSAKTNRVLLMKFFILPTPNS